MLQGVGNVKAEPRGLPGRREMAQLFHHRTGCARNSRGCAAGFFERESQVVDHRRDRVLDRP